MWIRSMVSALCRVLVLSLFTLPVVTAQVVTFTFTTIDVPGAIPSGINNRGQIVGSYGDHGFLLDNGNFSTIDIPEENLGTSERLISTEGVGINDVGQIVGNYRVLLLTVFEGLRHGFLLEKGKFTTVDVPEGDFSRAFNHPLGINNRGQIVGYSRGELGPTFGFLLDHGNFTTLRPPANIASCINDRGQIVLIAEKNFLLDKGKFIALDVPALAFATGITNSGEIVGEYSDESFALHGFLLNNGKFTTIDVPGATGTVVNGINDHRQIVGYYDDASGVHHGFVATY